MTTEDDIVRADCQSNPDDRAVIEAGYKPQLARGLGFFSSFAVSFSYMSVLTGIVANFSFVLGKSGPFGLWTWFIVAIGQMLIALIFAEMAGRIPLTGCSYNWNSKLTNPAIGWFAGWMALFAYVVGVAAVTVTIIPVLHSLLGFPLDASVTRYAALSLILLQAVINIYGVRAAAYINLLAAVAEIGALIAFGIAIAGVLLIHGHANIPLLTTVPPEPRPYLPAFLMACLLAGWTLLGFEGAADISEETVDVRRVAPRSIIQSVIACALLGFLFCAVLALGIPDLAQIVAAPDPVTAIVTFNLGSLLAKTFLVLVLISIFGCSLVNMTGASRVLFAMARDDRMVGAAWLKTISVHKVPNVAIWLIALIAGFFVCVSDTVTALYGAGAVLFMLFYLTTVVGYALGVRHLPHTDTFSLGRLRWPVVSLAIIWIIVEIGILTIPEEFHSVTIATGGVLIVGAILYLISGRLPKLR